jgi:proteasome assembly chaperone (PAC2) family protein
MGSIKKEEKKVERDQAEIYRTPKLQNPSLIVNWQSQDIGKLGSKIVDFLIHTLGGQEIAEIKPLGFFPLGGARFKNDIIQLQESKFWACEDNDLLIFQSDEPAFEHYHFLSTLLDIAQNHFRVKELYTINGIASFEAHTNPGRILTVFNQKEIKEKLNLYGLDYITYEGPPAISSYLLWVAQRWELSGVSLWPQIPFYLAAREASRAIKLSLSFLNRRFGLALDLGGFDLEINHQNEKIARLRKENSDIDQYISMLEHGVGLNEEQQLKLTTEVYEVLENN